MIDPTEKFVTAPLLVKNFFTSINFSEFIDEMVKKFELDGEAEVELSYLCQDLALRGFEPKSIDELIAEAKNRLRLTQEHAGQIAHFIWTRLKPLIDKLWKEAGEQQTAVESAPQAELTQLIEQIKQQQGPSRNIVDLTRVAKTKESIPLTPRPPAAAISIPITPEHPPVIQPDAPKPGSPLIARVIPVNATATPVATPINPVQKSTPADQPRSATPASAVPTPPPLNSIPQQPAVAFRPPAPPMPVRPSTPPVSIPQIKPPAPSPATPPSTQSAASIKPPPVTTRPVTPPIKATIPPTPITPTSIRSEPPLKSTLSPVTFIPSPQKSTTPPSTPKQTPPTTKKPPAPDVIDLSHL